MIAQALVAVLVVAMSAVFAIATFGFPTLGADPGGLALFPRIFSVLAGGGALVLIVRLSAAPGRAALARSWHELRIAWRETATGGRLAPARRMALVFALSIAYPWLIVRIGFVLATLGYVFCLMRLLSAGLVASAVFSAVAAVGLQLFYVQLLGAYVPPGAWLDVLLD